MQIEKSVTREYKREAICLSFHSPFDGVKISVRQSLIVASSANAKGLLHILGWNDYQRIFSHSDQFLDYRFDRAVVNITMPVISNIGAICRFQHQDEIQFPNKPTSGHISPMALTNNGCKWCAFANAIQENKGKTMSSVTRCRITAHFQLHSSR
jgi:hypothetical protein